MCSTNRSYAKAFMGHLSGQPIEGTLLAVDMTDIRDELESDLKHIQTLTKEPLLDPDLVLCELTYMFSIKHDLHNAVDTFMELFTLDDEEETPVDNSEYMNHLDSAVRYTCSRIIEKLDEIKLFNELDDQELGCVLQEVRGNNYVFQIADAGAF